MIEVALLRLSRADASHDQYRRHDDFRMSIEVDGDLVAAPNKMRGFYRYATDLDVPGSTEFSGARTALADANRPEIAVDTGRVVGITGGNVPTAIGHGQIEV